MASSSACYFIRRRAALLIYGVHKTIFCDSHAALTLTQHVRCSQSVVTAAIERLFGEQATGNIPKFQQAVIGAVFFHFSARHFAQWDLTRHKLPLN